jgi:hypothetical protein
MNGSMDQWINGILVLDVNCVSLSSNVGGWTEFWDRFRGAKSKMFESLWCSDDFETNSTPFDVLYSGSRSNECCVMSLVG